MIIQSLASNGYWQTLGVLLFLAVALIVASRFVKRKERSNVSVVGWYLTPKEVRQFNAKNR